MQQASNMSVQASGRRSASVYNPLPQVGAGYRQPTLPQRRRLESLSFRRCPRSHGAGEHGFVPTALASQEDQQTSNLPTVWRDVPDSEDVGVNEPFNYVSDVMTEVGLKATTAEASLDSIVPLLENVTGLPVVDGENKVVGVITRKVRIINYDSLEFCPAFCVLRSQRE